MTVALRDGHPGHDSAKAADPDAALTLAIDPLDGAAIETLRTAIAGRPALLLPVVADETTGFHAMAQVLGRALNPPVIAGEIVQTNKFGQTRAPAIQRLVTPAMFDGEVQPGAAYVLVDDHVGWVAHWRTCAAMPRRGAAPSSRPPRWPRAGTRSPFR